MNAGFYSPNGNIFIIFVADKSNTSSLSKFFTLEIDETGSGSPA